jgi:hypothetical protein
MHHEFIPPGQSGTGHFYMQVLQRLSDAVCRKGCHKWQGQWFLHHNNASSYVSLVVQQFHAEKNIPVTSQPPYSLDLGPSDICRFPTLKTGLKGTYFATMADSKLNRMTELRKIAKKKKAFC